MDAIDPVNPEGSLGLAGFIRVFFRDEEADRGDEKDDGEEIADPVESLEETEADGDEAATHQDGTEYTPEEDARLECGWNSEDAEEQEEDEEVVDGKGLLQGIASEELRRMQGARGAEDEEGEGKRS